MGPGLSTRLSLFIRRPGTGFRAVVLGAPHCAVCVHHPKMRVRATSQMAVTAGCLSLRSSEIA
jgi:hypothetical protein